MGLNQGNGFDLKPGFNSDWKTRDPGCKFSPKSAAEVVSP